MKIAVHNAQFSYHIGGAERLIYDQIQNLLNYPNVELTLITTKTSFKSPFFKKIKELEREKRNIKIITFNGLEKIRILNPYDSNNPFRWHLESLIFGLEAYQFYKKNKFDLIITHFSTDSLFIPINQKNILHLHGTPLSSSEIGTLSIEKPSAFVSVSENVKEGWIKLYPKLNEKLIKVVYPNINEEKFKQMNIKRDIDVLFVGRFILIKGIYDLLKAIKSLKKDIKVVLVGDGPEKENIKKTIREFKINNKIKIFSNISDKELSIIYNRAKIAVFPSYAKEGMVLTMLEAAASGTAIITSNTCSMPEFVKHHKTGLLVKPQDPTDLSKKIDLLLVNEKLRKRLGLNARNEIIKEWNTKKRIDELYKFYKEVSKK